MSDQRCGNCKWAKWQRTKNGRVNGNAPGECEFPLPTRLPMVAGGQTIHTMAIWTTLDATRCLTWEASR